MKRTALAALSAAALALAACSSGGGNATPTPTESASASGAPSAPEAPQVAVVDKPMFEVKGDKGTAPELSYSGDAPTELQRYTIDANPEGKEISDTDVVLAQYHGQVWNGDVFDSSYQRGAPAAFSLNGVIPGWKFGLKGARVGERVALSIPSAQGYPQGTPDGKIKAGDTITFVVEILDAVAADTPAPDAGAQVKDPKELNLDVAASDGVLSGVTVAEGTEAPTEQKLEKLTEGTGDKEITAESQFVMRVAAGFYEAGAPQRPAEVIVSNAKALPQTVGAKAGSRFTLFSPKSQQGPAQVLVFDVLKVF